MKINKTAPLITPSPLRFRIFRYLPLLLTVAALNAEVIFRFDQPRLTGTVLFEQTVTPDSAIVIKPERLPGINEAERPLEQCLWSVTFTIQGTEANFSPGKMVCIAPDFAIVEAQPQGTLAPLGQCQGSNCAALRVEQGTVVEMMLSEPLLFRLQARNERR